MQQLFIQTLTISQQAGSALHALGQFSQRSSFPVDDPQTGQVLLTLSIQEADGEQLRLGALISKVSMGIPDPGTVTASIRLQLHHRCD